MHNVAKNSYACKVVASIDGGTVTSDAGGLL